MINQLRELRGPRAVQSVKQVRKLQLIKVCVKWADQILETRKNYFILISVYWLCSVKAMSTQKTDFPKIQIYLGIFLCWTILKYFNFFVVKNCCLFHFFDNRLGHFYFQYKPKYCLKKISNWNISLWKIVL